MATRHHREVSILDDDPAGVHFYLTEDGRGL